VTLAVYDRWRQLAGWSPVRVSGPVLMAEVEPDPERFTPPPAKASRPKSAEARIRETLRQIGLNRVCVADHSTRSMLDDLERILRGDQ
jgi:hypothetical protein